MCAGIRDAANLAWKLDAVLGGRASDALLDSYQAEREPHARAAIELAIGMGRVVCTLDRAAAAQRDAAMLAARAGGRAAAPGDAGRAIRGRAVCWRAARVPGAVPAADAGDGPARLWLDDQLGDVASLDRPHGRRRNRLGGCTAG